MPKKKQQSSFKKFINWFKPTSASKGALLFVIAFAVIGGGYMAYKSFAATSTLINFQDKITVQPKGGDTTIAEKIKEDSGNKKGATVWKLAMVTVETAFYPVNVTNPAGSSLKICIMARTDPGKVVPVYVGGTASVTNRGGGFGQQLYVSGSDYKPYCFNSKGSIQNVGEPWLVSVNATSNIVQDPYYLSYISIELE